MLIQQIMGPLPAFDSLSFESQYLLNVRPTHSSPTNGVNQLLRLG